MENLRKAVISSLTGEVHCADASNSFLRNQADRVGVRPVMPFWSSEDTRNAVLASLVPGGAALAGLAVYSSDKKVTNWWESLRKPKWLSQNCVKACSVVDVATVAPLGYASYLVYKHGGGFDYNDTRLALGLYASNMVFAFATIPLVKNHNLHCLVRNTALMHVSAAAMAIAFFKIHKPAGYWVAPYALWTAFYTYMLYSIHKENDPVKDL